MWGLCMPTGRIYLVYTNGDKKSIAIEDLASPTKEIMEDKHIFEWVKAEGYENIESIMYERNGKQTIVSMADYYAEHGKELEA